MSDKTDVARPDNDRAALARKAAGLRRNGCTVDQISLALGVSTSTAKRLLQREAQRQRRHAEELGTDALAEELDRLSAVLRMCFAAMADDDLPMSDRLKAAARITAVCALRAKLQGLLDRQITIAHDQPPGGTPKPYTDEERVARIVELLSKGGKARD
jgi:hypothetical protein